MLAILGGTPLRKDPWPAWPEFAEAERSALMRVLESRNWGGYPAPGKEAQTFARAFGGYLGCKHVVLAANGTVTLKIALRALGISAGDEVIVPTLTWVATASAPAYLNAVPVLVDVDPETLCIDPDAIETAITDKTRAIIPVHLGCAMADMDRISAIAQKHNLFIVEDCAHAHGAKWNDTAAGAIGNFGSFSFQSSKLVTAGEGGALTTEDEELAARAQALTNCGRKEPGYDGFAGALFGWNDRITEWQAAMLTTQLSRFPEQKMRRKKNVAHFEKRLKDAEGELGISIQRRDERITRRAFYEVVALYDRARFKDLPRDRFVQALEAEGVPVDGDFYVPIQDRSEEIFPLRASEHPSIRPRYGESLSATSVQTPVATEAAYHRTLWFHHSLFLGTTKDVDVIVDAMLKIREHIDALL